MEPPPTEDDVRAAARQFVRKISGFQKPSRANEASFEKAIEDIARTSEKLLGALESKRSPGPAASAPAETAATAPSGS